MRSPDAPPESRHRPGNWPHNHSAMPAGTAKATAATFLANRSGSPSAIASAATSGVGHGNQEELGVEVVHDGLRTRRRRNPTAAPRRAGSSKRRRAPFPRAGGAPPCRGSRPAGAAADEPAGDQDLVHHIEQHGETLLHLGHVVAVQAVERLLDHREHAEDHGHGGLQPVTAAGL